MIGWRCRQCLSPANQVAFYSIDVVENIIYLRSEKQAYGLFIYVRKRFRMCKTLQNIQYILAYRSLLVTFTDSLDQVKQQLAKENKMPR